MNAPTLNQHFDLDVLLSGFDNVAWSLCPEALPIVIAGYVYVVLVELEGRKFPLYVGQTGRLAGRFGDYVCAQFHAPTDFRVGEACKYFVKAGGRIHLFYRESSERLKDERLILRELVIAGFSLLNSLSAFNYREASKEEELQVVHRFCAMAKGRAMLG